MLTRVIKEGGSEPNSEQQIQCLFQCDSRQSTAAKSSYHDSKRRQSANRYENDSDNVCPGRVAEQKVHISCESRDVFSLDSYLLATLLCTNIVST